MTGSINRKGRKWWAVLDHGELHAMKCATCKPLVWDRTDRCPRCGGPLTETRARRRVWHSSHATKRQAKDALARLLNDSQQGTYVEPTKLTVGEYLTNWLIGLRAQVRLSTWDSYRRNVERHVLPAIGGELLQRLTTARLNAFYSDRLASGLSPRTVRYIGAIMHRSLRDAVREGRAVRNPADYQSLPKQSRAEIRTWNPSELRAFLNHVRQDRLYAAWHLVAMTGLRRGEALGLKRNDLDLDSAALSVRRAVTAVGYEVVVVEPKTNRSRRRITLDPETIAVLREHLRCQAEERLAWGPGYQDEGWLFAREDGTCLQPDEFSKAFQRHVRAANLPRIRLHDLRHTWATLALRAGIHPKVVQERLGHSTITLTLDTYSHAVPALEEEAAARVAGLVTTAEVRQNFDPS